MLAIGIIILFFAIFYLGVQLLILICNRSIFASNLKERVNQDGLVNFSIIIAAKNESNNIPVLISALKKIDYPNDNYEVIIVDDNSSDNTLKIAEEQCSNIGNISVVKAVDKSYSGKRGALDCGIYFAKHPNILITDADCIPNENWLNYCTLSVNNRCDFYFGIAPFFQKSNIVNKISCFENFLNSFLAISAVKLKIPYTASARNFGFTKYAYNKIGGYSKTLDTISGDDDLLLREAINNNLSICSLTHPGSFVYSESKYTFKEYFSQRSRHTQTSFYYPIKQKLFLALWHSLNIVFVLSPLLLIVNNLFILLFLLKLIFDITKTMLFQKKFGYKFKMLEVIYLQLLYEFFIVVHFFRAIFGRIEWK